MLDRHFYLLRHHILFYIKFLLFCSLAPDEIKILCRKNKGVSPEEFVNPLDFNFLESHILLVHSTLSNILTGSLLGVELEGIDSLPVGYVEQVHILNTLPSHIWDRVWFLFSSIPNLQVRIVMLNY